MDIFGPHYTELRLFLKKYLKMEMDDVVDVTNVRPSNLWGTRPKKDLWVVEVVFNEDTNLSLEEFSNLENELLKLISIYGEEVNQVMLKRLFIVGDKVIK